MSDNALALVAIANELEAFIQECVPEASRLSKYGGTLFTLKPNEKEGQFCGVFLYSHHTQLSFSKGAELDDPKRLLNGSGKHRRHINFKVGDELDITYLKALLIQSSEL